MVALAVEPQGLECADVAGDEGEDGHTEPALGEDAKIRPLQEPGGSMLAVGGDEEVTIECTAYVREENENRGDAAKALDAEDC